MTTMKQMQSYICDACPAGQKCALRATRPPGQENISESGLRILNFKKRQEAEFTALLATDIFVIRRGAAKFSTDTGDIVRLLTAGDTGGVGLRYSRTKFSQRLKSLGPEIEVCALPWENFEKLMHERIGLWELMLQDIATFAFNMALSNHWARKSLRERALMLLRYLTGLYGIRYGQFTMIDIPLTKIDIASMMGTVQESAVRVLSELREDGLISSNGKRIVILDVERLEKLADGVRERDLIRARTGGADQAADD